MKPFHISLGRRIPGRLLLALERTGRFPQGLDPPGDSCLALERTARFSQGLESPRASMSQVDGYLALEKTR